MQDALQYAPAALSLAGVSLAILSWLIFFQMHFLVDSTHVRVRILSFSVRNIPFSDIAWADRKIVLWNEHWANSVNPRRVVRLRRRSGLVRNLILTPPDPDTFLRKLAEHGVEVRCSAS
jgi:hypothetical protein